MAENGFAHTETVKQRAMAEQAEKALRMMHVEG